MIHLQPTREMTNFPNEMGDPPRPKLLEIKKDPN